MNNQPMDRRDFVRRVGAGSLTALAASTAVAAEGAKPEKK